MNLSGFSAVYPGYSAQENATATTEQNQAAAKEAANKLLGAQVLGRALTGAQPTSTPNSGQPLAPPPGQASVPNAPPPQQAPPAAGPPGAPVAQGGGGMPEISLEALTKRIIQTTPQVQSHPEIMMAALERAAPLLDRQSKEDLAELRKKMQEQRLQQTGELAQARIEAARAAETGRNTRADERNQRTDRRLDQGDTREARLAASTAVRQDQGYQRLQLQANALAERAQATGDKQALGQWRATVDALHKRATEIIQSNSANSNLSKEDKAALLAEQRAAYEAQISAMRQRIGASTPTGGTVETGAVPAPKAAQTAPGATGGASAANTPPLAMLKPDTVTTFANGQKWTVGPDGQPKKVD